jgi:hypothetical protein
MSDKKIASLGSMVARKKVLPKVIESVYHQVDQLSVFLNDYPEIPDFLIDPNINIYMGKTLGNLGDVGKFYPLTNQTGYLFTIDDDIIYPQNYLNRLIDCIEKHKRKAFVCVHGNKLPLQKLASYYQDKEGLHFAKALLNDQFVDVPGTGTLGFHSSLYSFSLEDFPTSNMSDIWLYRISQEKHIPVVCIARPEKWLQPAISIFDEDSIYAKFYKNDSVQTNIINQYRGY